MMGMGEPLQNYAALVPALRVMLDDHGYGLSRRRVTVSTSGVVPMMDRLGEDCPVALAVSLHAPNDALRDNLVPLNRKYPLAELLDACVRYLEHAPRDFITFEYCMLDGVNDQPEHAHQLVELVRHHGGSGVSCKFNLIPVQPVPGFGPAALAAGGACSGWYLPKVLQPTPASSPPCARRAATTSMPPVASWPATVQDRTKRERVEAEKSLARAYELDAGNPVTGYNLASLLFQRGDFERAQFYIRRLNNSDLANAESLWLGVKVERRMNDRVAMDQLADQLKKRFPQSREAAAYTRGAFDE
jgi:hypothetical protein